MGERVTWTVDDGVADVRLDRPEKLNALDDAMFAGLIDAGERLAEDRTIRAVVLSGNGRGFCAGLDVATFAAVADGRPLRDVPVLADASDASDASDAPDSPDSRRDGSPDGWPDPATLGRGQRAVWVWATLPVPVIAAIHGPALGGGLQIALGADIRIVAPDARLGVLEINWGIGPDMTGTQVLARLCGLDVAKDLVWSGRTVDGAEAVRLGLATRVSDDPLADARTLAREIAARNPAAVRNMKRILNMAWWSTLAEAFAAEQDSMHELIGSENQTEAARANLERRSPTFTD